MTKLEDDEGFELQTKRWTKLMELRQSLTDHEIAPTCIDLAIANVFDPQKGHIIDSMIVDCEELIAMVLQLDDLQINSTNVKAALTKVFVPGARIDATDLVKLKELMKMRQRMSGMGIQTGSIEATIAEVFQPLSPAASTSKPENVSEASITKPCSPTVEAAEPVELDACATAIFKHLTVETSQPAGSESSGTAVNSPLSLDAGADQIGERPPRPTETKTVSKGTETSKPTQMPSEPTAEKIVSSNAECFGRIGASIKALDLGPPLAPTSSPLTKASSLGSSPSTARSIPSNKTTSSSSGQPTGSLRPSVKRKAAENSALGSAKNPICLESSSASKRQRTGHNESLEAGVRESESWRMPIQFVGTLGLHVMPRQAEANMNIVYDVESRRIIFVHGQQSLTALYPALAIDPEALLSVTRPTFTQSKDLKIRFMWLNTDAEEIFLDVTVATKQDCRYLIARLRDLTSFSEIKLSDSGMNRLFKDAEWVVNKTQNSVGLRVTKFSENVWVG